MEADFSLQRGRFAEALRQCHAVLSAGDRNKATWQRNARAAVQQMLDLVNESQSGGADLGLGLPIQSDLVFFVNGDLARAYLWNDVGDIAALPAPRNWLRKLQDFAEDCEGTASTAGSWSKPDGPAQWAKRFNVSPRTFTRMIKNKAIRVRKLSSKSYRVHVDDIPDAGE